MCLLQNDFTPPRAGLRFATSELIITEPEANFRGSGSALFLAEIHPGLGPTTPLPAWFNCAFSSEFTRVSAFKDKVRWNGGEKKKMPRPDWESKVKGAPWVSRRAIASVWHFSMCESWHEAFGVDKAQNWGKVTDCPGKPLALSSLCIVGNAAWRDHRSRKMNFPPWAHGFGGD